MAIDHTAATTRIKHHMDGVFSRGVFPGRGAVPQGGPYGKFFYVGREDAREGRGTLGNAMYRERWQVVGTYPKVTEPVAALAQQISMADADYALRVAFEGDITLAGSVGDLEIENTTGGVTEIIDSPVAWESFSFALLLSDLEGPAITR